MIHREGWYWMYIILSFLAVWFVMGVWLCIQIKPADESCEELAEELWEFQHCLKNQPICEMDKGIEAFANYHDMRNKFEEVCGEDRGDAFLSQ